MLFYENRLRTKKFSNLKDYASNLVGLSLENYPYLNKGDNFKKEIGVKVKYLLNDLLKKGIPPRIFNKLSMFANVSGPIVMEDLLDLGYEGFKEISEFLEMPEVKNRFLCDPFSFPIASLICNDIGTTRDKIKYYYGRLGIEVIENMISADFAKEKNGILKAYNDWITATILLKKPEICAAIQQFNIQSPGHLFDTVEGYISREGVEFLNKFSRKEARIRKINITRNNQGKIPIYGFQFNMDVVNESNLKSKRGVQGIYQYRSLEEYKSDPHYKKMYDLKKLEWNLNYINVVDIANELADIQVNISAVSEEGFEEYKKYCQFIIDFCSEEVFDNVNFKRDSELDGGIYYSVGFFTDYVLDNL